MVTHADMEMIVPKEDIFYSQFPRSRRQGGICKNHPDSLKYDRIICLRKGRMKGQGTLLVAGWLWGHTWCGAAAKLLSVVRGQYYWWNLKMIGNEKERGLAGSAALGCPG